jgi:hypothetical protein
MFVCVFFTTGSGEGWRMISSVPPLLVFFILLSGVRAAVADPVDEMLKMLAIKVNAIMLIPI